MTAAQALTASGLDTARLHLLIRPVDPSRIVLRPAPTLLKMAWGRGIQAITVRNTIYVDQRYLAGDPVKLGLLTIHELVHARQFHDLGMSRFLVRYLTGYLRGRKRRLGHRASYMAIDLEVEARRIVDMVR